MEVVVGVSTHSGWAIAVTAGLDDGGHLRVVDRRRVELIDADVPRQAYHAAANLSPAAADALVARVDQSIAACARAELSAIVDASPGSRVVGVAVVGDPRDIPDVATVLASHARMHASEGEQYRRGVTEAAGRLGLPALRIGPAVLAGHVTDRLGWPTARIAQELAAVRAELGPPWQRDHKDAALAALAAAHG